MGGKTSRPRGACPRARRSSLLSRRLRPAAQLRRAALAFFRGRPMRPLFGVGGRFSDRRARSDFGSQRVFFRSSVTVPAPERLFFFFSRRGSGWSKISQLSLGILARLRSRIAAVFS